MNKGLDMAGKGEDPDVHYCRWVVLGQHSFLQLPGKNTSQTKMVSVIQTYHFLQRDQSREKISY